MEALKHMEPTADRIRALSSELCWRRGLGADTGHTRLCTLPEGTMKM